MHTSHAALLTFVLSGLGAASAQQAAWTTLTNTSTPLLGMNFGSAFDPLRNKLVTFGGRISSPSGAPQWELHNGVWTSVTGGVRPSAREGHGMTFDAARGVIVLACGISGSLRRDDTWEYDGTTWTLRHTAAWNEDLDHFELRMAFDAARGEVLRYGGSGGGGLKGGTYSWNGTSWLLRASGGPPPRDQHCMAYDAERQRVVLFGGWGGNGLLSDTWEWNGSAWQQRFPTSVPPGRRESGMAWSGSSRKLLMFGGYGAQYRMNDLWHWDGTTWTSVPSTGTPPTMGYFEMELDTVRDRIVVLRGQESSTSYQGHYELQAPVTAPATVQSFGTGCPTSVGTPALQPAAGSLPYLGQQFTVCLTGLPASIFNPAFLLTGLSNTVWNGQPLPRDLGALGMPGCTALIAPEATELLAGGGTTACKTWQIPSATWLVGLQFHVQGAVLDLGANAAGFALSNAATAIIGQL